MIVGGGVAARSSSSALTKVDARTGAPLWTWRAPVSEPDFVAVSDPFVVDGRLLEGYGVRTFWGSSWVDPATGADLGDAGQAGLVRSVRGDLALLETYTYGSGTPVAVGFGVINLATGAGSGGLAAILSGGAGPQWTLGAGALFNAGAGTPAGASTSATSVVRAFPLTGISATCGPPEYPHFACPTWATDVGSLPTAPVVGAAAPPSTWARPRVTSWPSTPPRARSGGGRPWARRSRSRRRWPTARCTWARPRQARGGRLGGLRVGDVHPAVVGVGRVGGRGHPARGRRVGDQRPRVRRHRLGRPGGDAGGRLPEADLPADVVGLGRRRGVVGADRLRRSGRPSAPPTAASSASACRPPDARSTRLTPRAAGRRRPRVAGGGGVPESGPDV